MTPNCETVFIARLHIRLERAYMKLLKFRPVAAEWRRAGVFDRELIRLQA